MNARSNTVLKLLVLAAALSLFLWDPGAAPGPVAATVEKKKGALKVRSDMDWAKVPERQLREYTSHFDGAGPGQGGKEREIGKVLIPVDDGETVVTQAYEADPGEFVFSTVTPTVMKSKSGGEEVRLVIQSFKVGVSGSCALIGETVSDIPFGGSLSTMMLTPGRNYSLDLRVDRDEVSPVLLQTSGGDMSRNELTPEMFKKRG